MTPLSVTLLLAALSASALGEQYPDAFSTGIEETAYEIAASSSNPIQNFAIPPMRNGSPCTYNKAGVPMAPFCPGSKYNCVVKSLPNLQVQVYNGVCNSNYKKQSFCQFRSIPIALGVQNIRINPLCNTCDCKLYNSIPGANKAACMCDTLPPCYVDYDGKPYGKFACPPSQKMCVITRPGGGGKDTRGLPVDMGQCVYSGIGALCATGGPGWQTKFYAKGVRGAPASNNRCMSCTCSANGRLTNCASKPGCTRK